MNYISTRGAAPKVGFQDALLSGLAPDGGLYMPEFWPSLPNPQRIGFGPYESAALAVTAPFMTPDFETAELMALFSAAYGNFDHPEIAPLEAIGDELYVLELFHGPTLAFKDFAMQVLSRLMERALKRTGRRTTIVGATSGDTGAAAVEAFRGRDDIELFILFPHGRISDVQRRQMTTATEENVHVIALEGTFDDAQAIVKALFGDADLRRKYSLSAINSINWARIIAQTVYYFTASAKLGSGQAPDFAVPTGNFGDIFAGYGAKRMGLPVGNLIIATNENDILARALATGRYEPRGVHPTDSPSMDIQVSSNFERLLFEVSGRDPEFIDHAMAKLKDDGYFEIPADMLNAMRQDFSAYKVTRNEAASAMRALDAETGYSIDPHTAVGLAAAQKRSVAQGLNAPTILLATAHPAKFPEAVQRATGKTPRLPDRLHHLLEGKESFSVLPNSVAAVADYMKAKSPALELFTR